ncbi:Mrp/NBP35 family ATP-binding protein [Crocinitomicaceae bacterium]|nr:Mrp/NBP35 family ATP-binding protein [Crocinitomicaceae bacterium]MDC1361616.1 Mrp/NBP35 family ATP-binding protein [Crocinitomicaceae bacterium]
MIKREDVLEVLSNIQEPESSKDIVSSNLIEDLIVEENKVSLTVYVKNPAMHAKNRMKEAVEFNLKSRLKKDIEIRCTVKQQVSEANSTRKVLPKVKNIVAIASGKGGVGKSTITSNLAAGLAKKGHKVGIIDADIYGPSMPTMFDLVNERPKMTEIDGQSLIEPILSNGVKILSIGFFTDKENAVVWRGPMASKALLQMFNDAHWGELDFLLIDLPPGTGDIHLSLIQSIPLDGVVIVSTPQEVALADARRGVNMFKMDNVKVPIIGLVENMSWFTPEELPDNKYYIFGRDGAKNLSEGLGVPFLGQIPIVQSLRESGDIGKPAVLQEESLISGVFDELVENFTQQIEATHKA